MVCILLADTLRMRLRFPDRLSFSIGLRMFLRLGYRFPLALDVTDVHSDVFLFEKPVSVAVRVSHYHCVNVPVGFPVPLSDVVRVAQQPLDSVADVVSVDFAFTFAHSDPLWLSVCVAFGVSFRNDLGLALDNAMRVRHDLADADQIRHPVVVRHDDSIGLPLCVVISVSDGIERSQYVRGRIVDCMLFGVIYGLF